MEWLRAGTTVADVACGLGTSSRLIAEAFPASTVMGFDYHEESIRLADKAAAQAGPAGRVRFEVASAAAFPGSGYGPVTSFDCLHERRHARPPTMRG